MGPRGSRFPWDMELLQQVTSALEPLVLAETFLAPLHSPRLLLPNPPSFSLCAPNKSLAFLIPFWHLLPGRPEPTWAGTMGHSPRSELVHRVPYSGSYSSDILCNAFWEISDYIELSLPVGGDILGICYQGGKRGDIRAGGSSS